MSIKKRLTQEQSRLAALEAARQLLIDTGPQSVTLKAVSQRVGRTHANLLHHFGSASGLQKELASYLTNSVCSTIADAVRASRAGIGSAREVVDLAFDAFDREGAGALVSWMLLTGNEDALNPVIETIHQIVDELAAEEQERGVDINVIHEETLTLTLLALGDALVGKQLRKALDLPPRAARIRAEHMLNTSLFDVAGEVPAESPAS